MSEIQNTEFLERFILKACLESQQYMALMSSVVDPIWFEETAAGNIFTQLNEYFREYKKIPENEVLISLIDNESETRDYLSSVEHLDVNISNSYDFLINQSEDWIKRCALKAAILDSADIVNNNEEYGKIDQIIKDALSKSIKFNLGSDYWNTLGERLQRIFSTEKRVIPTYYPSLDELISGGFPPKTLNLFLAKTHGWKSLNMINQAARQVMHGHNVIFFSCEMSEDMVNQRFDSVFTGLDINRIYVDKKNELIGALKTKKAEDNGILIVKEYSPRSASALTFSGFLREMQFRDIVFDSCYIDYLNLCRPIRLSKTDDSLYSGNKVVAEEIRGLSWEWDFPIISASSFNRGGAKADFDDVDNEDVGESYGISMTADFALALGFDIDRAIYTHEIDWKIVKNRHGGRIGDSDRFFYDPKSLKIYDSSELNTWFEDAMRSGASDRPVHEKGKKKGSVKK